ncbi:chemotaxis protein CheW [Aquabacter spiritensis]|uniref:Purine-binding chemotaxis protein CheW n=1 Tax=Aquabacter spiritensis TaxID=933073 RepID=A0A4R3M411_9HYPH|nr:chemotaxis protein CheW [Aquabacter spiritensis]TCT07960.1 purine-binding chemotaxis protein CheW [Aquabacter spiritensis]
MSTRSNEAQDRAPQTIQYVTVRIGGQLFGVPIEIVHEVFTPDRITRVPLAPSEIEGVLNLRGRIVTMVNMRRLLGLSGAADAVTAVGIERSGEAFGLIIDEVGEVLVLETGHREPNPSNLDPRWTELVTGVHRLTDELMLVLDVERALGRLATRRIAA